MGASYGQEHSHSNSLDASISASYKEEIDELFIKAGIQPESWELRKYAVSCGFPIGYRGSRTGKVTLGQAFDPAISSNGTAEMFINPIMDDVVEVLLVLLHESSQQATQVL